jgi:LytR cell envelope-related transcriptional attenuator
MDHYAPTHDLTQPWRTRTIVVSAIAAAELLALVALGVVLLGKGWFQTERASAVRSSTHHRAAAAQPPAPPKSPAKLHATAPTARARPLLARAHTGVLVLNGNGRNGAAGAEATVLRAHGYPVNAVGNAKRNDYAASMVMFRPGYDREARRLARDLHVGIVTGLDGVLPSQLHGARLLIIVGN